MEVGEYIYASLSSKARFLLKVGRAYRPLGFVPDFKIAH